MIEVEQDLWEVTCDVICITTNGSTNKEEKNIMGGGCAKEAADRYPWLPGMYGHMLRGYGHHVFVMPHHLVMFPTKETIGEPASLVTIMRSATELNVLADLYDWKAIALPRPGAGLGGLEWDDVKPVIGYLDDRFIVVSYPPQREYKTWPREP